MLSRPDSPSPPVLHHTHIFATLAFQAIMGIYRDIPAIETLMSQGKELGVKVKNLSQTRDPGDLAETYSFILKMTENLQYISRYGMRYRDNQIYWEGTPDMYDYTITRCQSLIKDIKAADQAGTLGEEAASLSHDSKWTRDTIADLIHTHRIPTSTPDSLMSSVNQLDQHCAVLSHNQDKPLLKGTILPLDKVWTALTLLSKGRSPDKYSYTVAKCQRFIHSFRNIDAAVGNIATVEECRKVWTDSLGLLYSIEVLKDCAKAEISQSGTASSVRARADHSAMEEGDVSMPANESKVSTWTARLGNALEKGMEQLGE